jgi:hypothetical protein
MTGLSFPGRSHGSSQVHASRKSHERRDSMKNSATASEKGNSFRTRIVGLAVAGLIALGSIIGLAGSASAHPAPGIPVHEWQMMPFSFCSSTCQVSLGLPVQVTAYNRTAGLDAEWVAARVTIWVIRNGVWTSSSSIWLYTIVNDQGYSNWGYWINDKGVRDDGPFVFTRMTRGERYYLDISLYWYSRGTTHTERSREFRV